MMKLRAVLFDADGMVINKKHLFSRAYTEEFGVPMTTLLKFFEGDFQLCLTGHADLREILRSRLVPWKWPGTVDELLKHWFDTENSTDTQVVGHIKELRGKGVKCALATNNEKYRTEYMKSIMGFNQIFDYVYSSCYLGVKKPDPTFYSTIIKDLNVLPEDVIVWDDDPKNIAGAKSLGLLAEVYTDFDSYKRRMAS